MSSNLLSHIDEGQVFYPSRNRPGTGIIFCHPFDRDAIWLYLELKKHGFPVQLLAPEQVLMAREWTQSLGDGKDNFVVAVKDGPTISGGEIAFFFNRIQFVDAPIWRRAVEDEREYIRAEMTAFLMSWLSQVQQQCRMINPPFGQNLCGPGWGEVQWTQAAYEAGFQEIAEDRRECRDKVLVVGNTCISRPKNDVVTTHCARLARIARSPLLEVGVRDRGCTFVSATAIPAFSGYGPLFLSAFQQQLMADAS